ncbi:MAG: ABC transporter permease [Ruminococcus sp.]|jgi:putative ABC transport system permease protein|nr:ABC transporter permease [Ruminococcus sp.]
MVKKMLRGLFRQKLRFFLTVVGISVGVCAVVLVSAIGEIGKNEINTRMSGMGMDNLLVMANEGSKAVLTISDLQGIKKTPDVQNAMPLLNIVTDATILSRSSQVMMWGINEDAGSVIELDVIHGRMINRGDVKTENRVCMVDEALAISSYKRSNIVGKKIDINFGTHYETMEVVGVVKSGVNVLQNMLSGFVPDFVYLPYSVMQTSLGTENFDEIAVKVTDANIGDSVAARIETNLSEEYEYASVSVENLLKQKDNMLDILSTVTLILSAVAGISLIVSGTSIMTVMLTSVTERTREIGIKKSIGADRLTIMFEFLSESAIITLIGAAIGLVSGLLLSLTACTIVGIAFSVSPAICIFTLIISVVIGGIFGAYPAYKAASLNPVEALRV